MVREQGFPGYTIWKRSGILDHNTLHVCTEQGSTNTIVEWEMIRLFRSDIAYV